MTWWWRSRGGVVTLLVGGLAIPGLLTLAHTTTRLDIWQFLTLALPVALAWSLASRDDPREVRAQRPSGVLDAAWVAAVTGLSIGMTATLIFALGGEGSLRGALFLLWNLAFSAGLASVLMRWVSPATSALITVVCSLALYTARFVFSPTTALIHAETPVALAVAASAIVFAAGLVAVAVRRRS